MHKTDKFYNYLKFLKHIQVDINQFLTFLLAIAGLFISYLTYKNAADTSDLKNAVAGLSILAKQTARQADIAQQQLLVMSEDRRPWIKVELQSAPLQWIPNADGTGTPTGLMAPKIIMKNVGSLPAINVNAAAFSYLTNPQGAETMETAQRRVCGNVARKATEPNYGKVIFPGDQVDSSPYIGEIGFSINSTKFKPIIKDNNGKQFFAFYIQGCVDYMFGTGKESHQTFFSYVALHIVKSNQYPTGSLMEFFEVGVPIPADEIRLAPSINGNSAN